MRISTFFFVALGCLVGCGPGNSDAIRHLFKTTAPVEFRVGYVGEKAAPPFAFGGAIDHGWTSNEKVLIRDFLCNNARALFPNKECNYPESLDDMTLVSASPSPEGYSDEDIFTAAQQIPGDATVLKILFLDGQYAVPSDTVCAYGHNCATGVAAKRSDTPGISAVFVPTIRKYASDYFFVNTDDEKNSVFAYHAAFTVVHEFGHQLGLVDGETSAVTDHEDPNSSPHHCNNTKCVMHASVSGTSWWDWSDNRKKFGKDADVMFDKACQADVHNALTY